MVLMVFFNSRISPLTSAWPPNLPSVPTSRATRVTSEEKELSWSTIVLMVFFNSRISPLTSTVIFLERSPLATAVVTSAILRTWAVRLLPIRLTLSVRSFQTPATPLTFACPPSLPSEPTSRATRVTSMENRFNCFCISLTSLAMRENSPCKVWPPISRGISWERLPFATELITWAISMVGCTRSEIRVLSESTPVPQEPFALGTSIRWVSFPCLPMVLPALLNSRIMASLREIISLRVSQIFPFTPISSIGMRTLKFPFRTSIRILNNSLSSRRDSSGGNSHLRLEELLLPVESLFWVVSFFRAWPFLFPGLPPEPGLFLALLAAIDHYFFSNLNLYYSKISNKSSYE